MTRYVPNTLSVLRIMLSFLLIPVMPSGIVFVVIYLTIGITDVLDGLIARKYGYESDTGAKLDSTADLVFYLILMYMLLKLHLPLLQVPHLIALIAVVFIRLLNMLFTKLKYKRVVFIHTLANKLSGFVIYLLPLIFLFLQNSIVIWSILIIVFFAAAEELLITAKYSEPDLNRRSIFIKNKK